MRLLPGLLAAALVTAVLAGCGQSGKAGNAASVVPESAAAYVSVDTSFEGDQWRTLSGLLEKFPGGEGMLEQLLDEATAEAGLEGDADVQAAIGPEVALVVLELPTGPEASDPPFVLLTQPEDEDAFAQLVEGEDAVRAEVRGWQAVARTEADLDRYRDALEAGSLEGSAQFEDAMDDLGDGLVHAYLNGEAIMGSLASDASAFAMPLPLSAFGDVGSVGLVVRAEDNGLRVEGRAVPGEQAGGAPTPEPYEAQLPDELPDGVLALLSFNGLGEGLAAGAAGLGPLLPVDLDEIAKLFAGESAVYVRPGRPQPTVTLVTQVDDEAAALRAAESVVALAGPEGSKVAYDAFDGLLVVSSSPAEIAALRGDGPRLSQDEAFESAADEAGMPDETTGFGYVDLEALVPLFLGFVPPTDEGASPELDAYLEPLGSVVFWGETSGEVQDFSLFVGIE